MTKRKDPKEYKKIGCPTMYTSDLADKICERVAMHPIGLQHICDMYDDMPAPQTIWEWRAKYPDFGAKYLSAKGLQAMLLVEEIDDLLDYRVIINVDDKGQQRIDPPSASIVIARCNNRKWQAARLAPRIYGDRLEAIQSDKDQDLLKSALEHKRQLDEQNKKEY